ncbi:MAG: single-stranded-DNA-specific exonuclease RecJ [Spirulina sp. SIO3F2]|nr:single-stranded-DNA-specific exonuclease RecJ [Spirulina sp. SIO3F2]
MQTQWQLPEPAHLPPEFLAQVQHYCQPPATGEFAAQLLWQRGIRTAAQLKDFLDVPAYQPRSAIAFGAEITQAVARIQQARNAQENVTIWGDFDADGVTSTAVLWDGLGQFFTPETQLDYYIPHREKESHGLNNAGIERLAAQGTQLIITCDTGSTNLSEIDYAQSLGIDIIVTDHHTLPPDRPNVVAIINPRYLETEHPLYHLSGVGVAYKFMEALYEAFPGVPSQPLEELLDLVAIGLIADLVKLQGDCRYLAQQGISQLKKQVNPETATRPGVAKLLELCKRTGDRPTDISFGVGPRINAVSRIYGDAHFCVELLTSRDRARCEELALKAELANSRRKETQKRTLDAVQKQLEQVDLSTTNVIVLADPQWSTGVLGLVAGQIAQDYGRPTVLLTIAPDGYAKGSARSTHSIDLYELVYSQRHLLHRFGGHPFAAGLSLRSEHLPLFVEGINQELRRYLPDPEQLVPIVTADLAVTVQDLGQALFKDFNLLEPCGMSNPVPRLLLRNCWFDNLQNRNIKDSRGQKLKYLKTTFRLCDATCKAGFPGIWWGHNKDELNPEQRYDAIVELDYNTYSNQYEVRLIEVRPTASAMVYDLQTLQDSLLDWREQLPLATSPCVELEKCPQSWDDLHQALRHATQQQQPLALNYREPTPPAPDPTWQTLVGVAKYLQRTGETATFAQLQAQLNLDRTLLTQGLDLLQVLGFSLKQEAGRVQVLGWQAPESGTDVDELIARFEGAIAEAQFRQRYFAQVPLETLRQQLVIAARA